MSACCQVLGEQQLAESLKLNPDKAEFLVIGTKHSQEKIQNLFPVNILGINHILSEKVKNLGATLNLNLSFSQHVLFAVRSSIAVYETTVES